MNVEEGSTTTLADEGATVALAAVTEVAALAAEDVEEVPAVAKEAPAWVFLSAVLSAAFLDSSLPLFCTICKEVKLLFVGALEVLVSFVFMFLAFEENSEMVSIVSMVKFSNVQLMLKLENIVGIWKESGV